MMMTTVEISFETIFISDVQTSFDIKNFEAFEMIMKNNSEMIKLLEKTI